MAQIKPDINALMDQLEAKKTEYAQALKSGVIFDELKKIFFEIKELKQKIDSFNTLTVESRSIPGKDEAAKLREKYILLKDFHFEHKPF